MVRAPLTIERSRRSAAVAALAAALALAPPAAAAKKVKKVDKTDKAPVFRFQPAPGFTWVETVKDQSYAKGPSGRMTATLSSRARKEARKAADGWTVVDTQLSFEKSINGARDPHPAEAAMDGVALSYLLDDKGALRDITGYERLLPQLKAIFPKTSEPAMQTLATDLAAADKGVRQSIWRHRVQSFLGQRVPLGAPWTADLPFELPSKEKVTVHWQVRAVASTTCAAHCAHVEYFYDSDPRALPPAAGATEVMAWLSQQPVTPTGSDATAVSGGGLREVDTDTGLIHSETEERTIRTKDTVAQEKLEYRIEKASR